MFDLADEDRLTFTIQSITLFKHANMQLLYTRNLIKFASFQQNVCTSDYKEIPISSGDYLSISKNLAEVCNRYRTFNHSQIGL